MHLHQKAALQSAEEALETKCKEMADKGQMVFVPEHGYFFVYWKINVDMKMLKALLGIAGGAAADKFCG